MTYPRSDGLGQHDRLLPVPSVSSSKDRALWEETSKHMLAEKARRS